MNNIKVGMLSKENKREKTDTNVKNKPLCNNYIHHHHHDQHQRQSSVQWRSKRWRIDYGQLFFIQQKRTIMVIIKNYFFIVKFSFFFNFSFNWLIVSCNVIAQPMMIMMIIMNKKKIGANKMQNKNKNKRIGHSTNRWWITTIDTKQGNEPPLKHIMIHHHTHVWFSYNQQQQQH